jgi:hypothetical protein
MLSVIREMQGLDFKQGLDFLVQLFILELDLLRAKQGKESILFGPTYAQFDIKTAEGRNHLLSFENQPLWELTVLFEFWDLFGGRHASGFYKSPDGKPGIPNYFSIPPTWLSIGKLKEIYGDTAKSWKIPLLIEPIYKPVAESFLGFFRENHQAGMPLNVCFSAPNKEGQVASEVKQNAFHKDGDFWTLTYEGRTVRLKDARGLHYIAFLLHHPHRAFHVMELVSALATPEAGRTTQIYRQMSEAQLDEHHLSVSTLGDAGPVLDDRARRELKRRSDDLRERLEASDFETPEQAADMRQEMHMIDAQLRNAIGLGGKERKSADQNERARKAVSKAASRSLETIRRHSPELWQHLQNALKIGYFCSYVPNQPTDWIT